MSVSLPHRRVEPCLGSAHQMPVKPTASARTPNASEYEAAVAIAPTANAPVEFYTHLPVITCKG